MPTAVATTASVNSSREPVRATRHRNQGNSLRPTISMNATKAPTCASVMPSDFQMLPSLPEAVPPKAPARAGSMTSISTVTRSSTTSQPIAMRPLMVSSWPRSSRARSSTTVLATDTARPKTRPAPRLQPHI